MLNRFMPAVLASIVLLLAGAASATAVPDRPPTPPPTDFWQKMGFMNMAHQGGERENPGNTLFAFKKAIKDGADVIDLDTTLTEDGVLVATHDEEPCHTSNAPCGAAYRFRNQTLEELRAYDFAYWFSPGLATYYDKSLDVPHPYRGIATGDIAPPEGYSPEDFRIATFDEVLTAFPDTPINVELKPYAGVEGTAQAAADVLAAHPGREKDVIINAFSQSMLETFHTKAPDHLALGGSSDGTLAYVQGNPITPRPVAVQPPDKYNLSGAVVDTLPILRQFFEHDGFIAVVWPSDLDPEQETNPWYEKLISQGADAINTMFPARLHEYLCENGIPRPDGSLRCPEQQCPEGFSGFAPHCEEIPVCPEGTEGTPPDDCKKVCPAGSILVGEECQCPTGKVGVPPNCKPHGDPKTVLKKVWLAPKKRKVQAGKQVKLQIKIRARVGLAPKQIRIKLRSSNRQVKIPKSVVIRLRAPAGRIVTRSKTIRAKIKRNARGKAKITATHGKLSAKSVLTVKKAKKKKRARR